MISLIVEFFGMPKRKLATEDHKQIMGKLLLASIEDKYDGPHQTLIFQIEAVEGAPDFVQFHCMGNKDGNTFTDLKIGQKKTLSLENETQVQSFADFTQELSHKHDERIGTYKGNGLLEYFKGTDFVFKSNLFSGTYKIHTKANQDNGHIYIIERVR